MFVFSAIGLVEFFNGLTKNSTRLENDVKSLSISSKFAWNALA